MSHFLPPDTWQLTRLSITNWLRPHMAKGGNLQQRAMISFVVSASASMQTMCSARLRVLGHQQLGCSASYLLAGGSHPCPNQIPTPNFAGACARRCPAMTGALACHSVAPPTKSGHSKSLCACSCHAQHSVPQLSSTCIRHSVCHAHLLAICVFIQTATSPGHSHQTTERT